MVKEWPRVVCSAFIEKQGKFLLVLDPDFKVWRVPGGRMELDESPEQTLIREMKEETGITITDPRFLGFGRDWQFMQTKNEKKSRLILYYHVTSDEQITLDPAEAEESKWVTLDELKAEQQKEAALDDFFERFPTALQ